MSIVLAVAPAVHIQLHPWTWQPDAALYVFVISLALMYLYVTRVIGPKVVPAGEPIVTRSQTRWFSAGVIVLLFNAGWPVDRLADQFLFSAHMVQHMVFMWAIPPMILMGIPEWFARLVLGSPKAKAYRIFRVLTRPLLAGVLLNATFVFVHDPLVINNSVWHPPVDFADHASLMVTGLLMWTCVCGPLPELRISLPQQCIYLFAQSIIPTVPGAWFVFSQGAVYKAYVHPWPSLWGLTPTGDQQLAGFIMKSLGGLYLCILAAILFFRWGRQNDEADDTDRKLRERDRLALIEFARRRDEVLTYAQVTEEFEKTDPTSEVDNPPLRG